MPFKNIFEEIVKQLITFLIAHRTSPRFPHLGQLRMNRLFFFRLRFLLFLKLHRQALPHTEGCLPINILKLTRSTNFLTLTKKFRLALPKLLLKCKFAPQPQLAHNDNIQERIIHPKNITVLAHQLV